MILLAAGSLTQNAGVRVNLLGGFALFRADASPVQLTGARARGILTYLLLAPDGRASRERLCELFWGDRGEAQARSSLRQALFDIRAVLHSAGSDALVSERDVVRLEKQRISSDVHDLAAVLEAGDPQALTAALASMGDILLDDLGLGGSYQDWRNQETSRLDGVLAASVRSHLAALTARAYWSQATLLAEAWLRRDPLDEETVALAIRADRATGANAVARRRYIAFKELLARELAIAPGSLVESAMNDVAAPDAFTQTAAPVMPAGPRTPLLAVLAFDNLSADAELAWFCDGVSDEIQRTVARASELKVVARASSFQFRGTDKTTVNVSTALGVTHLLDGAVRRSGARVRISAELVDCATHSVVWSDRFDGDLDDVFVLQDRIAAEVARALKVTLVPTSPGTPLEPAAYELFMRALSALAEGDSLFDDSAFTATPMLEEVTLAAPDYAPAWELLAVARAKQLRSGRSHRAFEDERDGVIAAAETALRLDPTRGGAYGALATLEPWGAYQAREDLLCKALELSPQDAGALTDMSHFCWGVGRFRDALRFAERACELNPLMPAARLHVAQMRAYVKDYEGSVRMLEELHARWPKNAGILRVLLELSSTLGFPEAYERAVCDIVGFDGRQARYLERARNYAEVVRSTDPAIKAKWVEDFSELLERRGILPVNYIVAIDHFGLPDDAFTLAERATFEHVFDPASWAPSGVYPGTLLGPWCTMLQSTRIVALCDRLGLCRYWMASGNWPDCTEWVPFDFTTEVRRTARQPERAH